MKRPDSVTLPRLLFYLLPLVLLATYRLLLPTYVCDDAYISLRTASHLAEGSGFGFNAGEAIYVTTSPLWVMLLAGVKLIVGDIVLAAELLGFLFEAGALLLMVRLSEKITGSNTIGFIAALLLCVNPVFVITSGSGMEVSLYLCVILFSLLSLLRKNYLLGLAFASLALWVRFDGIVLLGAAVLWVVYDLWRESHENREGATLQRPRVPLLIFIPLLILGGYILFGLLVFDTAIPTSVQRKGMTSPPILSGEWVVGAWRTGREFLKVVIGKSGYWITGLSPLILLVPLFFVGSWISLREKIVKIVPLLTFTLAYIASFVGSGSEYARHFPWYFVPILPLVTLLTSIGLVRVGEKLLDRLPLIRRGGLPAMIVLVLLWGGVNWLAISNSREILQESGDGPLEREQVYAAGATWIGKYLPRGSTVAGNEIGAIGFFLPSDIRLLDMYGILRRPEDLGRSYIDMVREKQPEAILVRENFENREGIDREMPGTYVWHRFRTLEIGLRSDLSLKIEEHTGELLSIYERIQ